VFDECVCALCGLQYAEGVDALVEQAQFMGQGGDRMLLGSTQ
jgi:hypothetical protein